jgi:hypothetical protein
VSWHESSCIACRRGQTARRKAKGGVSKVRFVLAVDEYGMENTNSA